MDKYNLINNMQIQNNLKYFPCKKLLFSSTLYRTCMTHPIVDTEHCERFTVHCTLYTAYCTLYTLYMNRCTDERSGKCSSIQNKRECNDKGM